MKLLNIKDWKNHTHKNTAELFFYSLSGNNSELIDKILTDWKNLFGDINSLFYSVDNNYYDVGLSYQDMCNAIEKKRNSLCLTDRGGLNIKCVQWGKMNPRLFMKFQQFGLELPSGMANEFFLNALNAKNISLMEFFLPYVSLDKQHSYNTNLEISNSINDAFIDGTRLLSTIGRSLAKNFDEVTTNTVISYLPVVQNDLYIRLLGWACTLKNDTVIEYFMHHTNVIELLGNTENFLKNNPNSFFLQTKNGSIGEDQEILSHINKLTMYIYLQNKIPHKTINNAMYKLKI